MSAPITPHEQLEIERTAQRVVAGLGNEHRIDPFARISPSAVLAEDVVIKSGAFVPAGVYLESGCHIGPNAVFVEGVADGSLVTRVGSGVFIGANSTIHAGLTIGARVVIRAGSVVTRSVPAGAIVEGVPAAIVGYVDVDPGQGGGTRSKADAARPAVEATAVKGVTLHRLPVVRDLCGLSTSGVFDGQIPFVPQRCTIVSSVPSRAVRMASAQRGGEQFLICVHGACTVTLDDALHHAEVVLDAPYVGLYVPPLTWSVRRDHTPDARVVVFNSVGDEADQLTEYGDFLAALAKTYD